MLLILDAILLIIIVLLLFLFSFLSIKKNYFPHIYLPISFFSVLKKSLFLVFWK